MSYARNLARIARAGVTTVKGEAEIRALDVYSGIYPAAIETRCFADDNDKGGGLWRWYPENVDAEVPGLVVKPAAATTGRYIRNYSGPFHLSWAGVNPNAADVAPIISEVMAAIGQAHEFILPAGTLLVKTRVETQVPAGFVLTGQGVGATLLQIDNDITDFPIFVSKGDIANNGLQNQGILFRDFTVSGYNTVDPEGRRAFDFLSVELVGLLMLSNMQFDRIRGHAYKALRAWDHRIINCDFTSCGSFSDLKAAVYFGESFLSETPQAGTTNGIHWTSSRVEACDYRGLELYKCAQVWMRGKFHGPSSDRAWIGDFTQTCLLYIGQDSHDINLIGSQVSPINASDAILLGDCYNVTIGNCTFDAANGAVSGDQYFIRCLAEGGLARKFTISKNVFGDFQQTADLDITEAGTTYRLDISDNSWSFVAVPVVGDFNDICRHPTTGYVWTQQQWEDESYRMRMLASGGLQFGDGTYGSGNVSLEQGTNWDNAEARNRPCLISDGFISADKGFAFGSGSVEQVMILTGLGSPITNGLFAGKGSLYLQGDGTAGSLLWAKINANGVADWVAIG